MARKRMLAPSFWTDEKIGECSITERLLFLGLISNADDEGIGRGNPKLLKSLIFPYDDLRVSDFEKSLDKLSSLGLINLYQSGGQNYYVVPNFKKHQTINKPTPSEFPQPNKDYGNDKVAVSDYCGNATVVLPPNIKEVNISEERISEDNTFCQEQNAPDRNMAISLTLNDKTEYLIFQEQVDEWADLYPAVNVIQQLRNMKGWLDANPKKRKTKDGVLRFVAAWLSKTQNQGGDKADAKTNTPAKPNYGNPDEYDGIPSDDLFLGVNSK